MVMSCPILRFLIYSGALKYSEFPKNIEKLIGNIFESLFLYLNSVEQQFLDKLALKILKKLRFF